MPVIELTVNGKKRSLEADADMPLLWALRDLLGLTGTKYGCGAGICGACTVLEGDASVRACQTPLASAAGRAFTTIEGLSPDGSDACQRAWLEEDVSQCGYCQAGMLMEVRGLLRRVPQPSDEQIEAALSEHVCRCGSYPRIRRAVKLAAQLGTRR